MHIYDFHMHCNFSSDSKASPEDMIRTAINKNLSGICFTDHNDFDYPPENGEIVFNLDFKKCYDTLSNLREQYNHFPIYIGVEQGLSVPAAERINNYDSKKQLDFIIGSSHLVNGEDPYYPEFWLNRSTTATILAYFESILENIKYCNNFDVYGHLDYVVRYAPDKDTNYNWKDYSDLLDCILKQLIERGKGIEVNTSGLKSGLKYPNPCLGILQRYRELGGEILTIGSDAHCPEHIAYDFEKLPALLTSAGFKYYSIFKNRKPEFIKIEV